MRLWIIPSATAVAAIAYSAFAFGPDQIPDMRGRWAGKTYTIAVGAGNHWPTNAGKFAKPGLFEKNLVFDIKGQDGDRFWGVETLSGNGETTTEPFLGELTGERNSIIVMVDTDGYVNGRLIDREKFTFCYQQAGGPPSPGFSPVSPQAVISCSAVTRAR